MQFMKEDGPVSHHQDDFDSELAAQILKAALERQEKIRNLAPPCPDCSKPGKYHQQKSEYYGGRPVYECPNSHQFFWSFEHDKGDLLSE